MTISASATSSERPATRMFERLKEQAPDALLALIGLFRDDPRPGKIDLGVGVYRDEQGRTPVLKAMKDAERVLLEQQPTKAYLGPEGDQGFVDRLIPIIFGKGIAGNSRLTGIQTPGGTGALRLAAELIALTGTAPTVWVGRPTWPNHEPILAASKLKVENYRYFDQATQTLLFDEMMSALGKAQPGDVVLLHGCCHNPAGADLDADQWAQLAELMAARGLVPLMDLAYQGLGQGLDDDAAGVRLVLGAVDQALVAYSCDKNFGLYRERTGALYLWAHDSRTAGIARANTLSLARAMWSMPPDHGAAAVRIILESEAMTLDWKAELETMRLRMVSMRQALAASHPRLAPLARQNGMFSLLPIDKAAVAALRNDHAIYMADSGRISVAGLQSSTVEAFARALAPHL